MRRSLFVYPAPLHMIEQLTVAKILGVFVHDSSKCDNHVDFILSIMFSTCLFVKVAV